jgi:two-component system copper resistance phosphate regulon response regulator CusR
MNILLIEDESKTAQYVKQGLEENGFKVEIAPDGLMGKKLALTKPYSLIISDIMLPGLNGREITKQLRDEGIDTPILMLTALSNTDDIVEGFHKGADDYLTKPFEFRELLVRIKAITKRTKNLNNESKLVIDDLTIDVYAKIATRSGKIINLTVKEFALLEYLVRHQGRVISKSELAKEIWKIDFDTGTNTIEVYVNYLRNKIDKGFSTKLIHTHIGMGYIIRSENAN